MFQKYGNIAKESYCRQNCKIIVVKSVRLSYKSQGKSASFSHLCRKITQHSQPGPYNIILGQAILFTKYNRTQSIGSVIEANPTHTKIIG